jgi:hypothetical protein
MLGFLAALNYKHGMDPYVVIFNFHSALESLVLNLCLNSRPGRCFETRFVRLTSRSFTRCCIGSSAACLNCPSEPTSLDSSKQLVLPYSCIFARLINILY